MGLVFWIDQNTFATSLIERAFKAQNKAFYSVSSVNDFLYLVEDLRPSVVVLDGETAAQGPESFREQYERSSYLQSLPFLIVGQDDGLGYVKNVLKKLEKPFDPFQIPGILEQVLRSN